MESIPEQIPEKSRRYATKIISGLIFISLIWYLSNKLNVFDLLSNFNLYDIVALVSWNSLFILTFAFQNYLMIRRIAPSVLFSDMLFIQSVNNLLNKISPRGGAIYRAAYLRKHYSFPYSKFLSTITGLYVISFSVQSLVGLSCLAIIYHKSGVSNLILSAAFLGIFLICGLLIYINPEIQNPSNRVLKILSNILSGWVAIKNNKMDILMYGGVSFTSLILTAIQYNYIYRLLGLEIGFIETVFISSLGVILTLLNITPDGLGITEAVLIYSSKLISPSTEILVLGSLVMRGVGWLSALLFGGISYIILERYLHTHDRRQG